MIMSPFNCTLSMGILKRCHSSEDFDVLHFTFFSFVPPSEHFTPSVRACRGDPTVPPGDGTVSVIF